MPRIAISAFALALTFCVEAFAQAPVNFSGTWKTDSSRSESIHQSTPIGPITLVILQTPAEISIETRTRPKDKSAIANEKLVYRLDGSESSQTQNADGPIVCKAHWDGSGLVAETARNLNGSTVTTRWLLKMDAAGKELTVQKALTVQHGYQSQSTPANNVSTATDVFLKTSPVTAKK